MEKWPKLYLRSLLSNQLTWRAKKKKNKAYRRILLHVNLLTTFFCYFGVICILPSSWVSGDSTCSVGSVESCTFLSWLLLFSSHGFLLHSLYIIVRNRSQVVILLPHCVSKITFNWHHQNTDPHLGWPLCLTIC